MTRALLAALLTFVVTYIVLTLIEKYVHKITQNPYKNYRWGVWLFAILMAGYVLVTNLGIN